VLPEAFRREVLEPLKRAVADPEVARALSHLPIIPLGVIELVSSPALFQCCRPSLLSEVAEAASSLDRSSVAHLLREVLQMRSALDPERGVSLLSVKQLHAIHDELLGDYLKWLEMRARAGKFPPAPVPGIPGIIEPVLSAKELIREGRSQSNCVGAYVDRVRGGKVFIYRVTTPERATLSLVNSTDGRWEIGQLLASHNRAVSSQTQDVVEEWMHQWQAGLMAS